MLSFPSGLSMQEARGKVVKRMEELGFLNKIEPHQNRVGKSYRSKAVIEPFVSALRSPSYRLPWKLSPQYDVFFI
jgi:hypothetical protein